MGDGRRETGGGPSCGVTSQIVHQIRTYVNFGPESSLHLGWHKLGSKAFREGDAEAMQQEFLLAVRLGHAAESDGGVVTVAAVDGKYDVPRLDLDELVEQTPWRIAQAAAAHPTRQRLPHRIRQEAHQDMGEHAVLFVMPDRAEHEFVFRDAKRPFGFGQLDVMFPQRLRIRVIQSCCGASNSLPRDVPILPTARCVAR